LAVELGAMMANEPVEIRHGRKIIEASAATISKGTAVRRVPPEKAARFGALRRRRSNG
jgi:trehalose-6-phosphatase